MQRYCGRYVVNINGYDMEIAVTGQSYMNQALARHMPSVEGYRSRLATLQGSWDTLSLLSHLSGDATDMGGTRQAFESLTSDLVGHLATETHRKALQALKAKSQIAIDIIVRNLFERTADIGFLSTDNEVRQFLRQHQQGKAEASVLAEAADRLQRRFQEYVAKYSVYEDVILLAPGGEVLVRLGEATATHSADALLNDALTTSGAYVETYRYFDLLPQRERSLVYSYRVMDEGRATGVLCLCFRLDHEIAGIFSKLHDGADWNVFTLLDPENKVIASSDPWQVPVGASMTPVHKESGGIVRFAGREYLAITRRTQGFQGYMGPGWLGHAMVPIEHAFSRQAGDLTRQITKELLAGLRESTTIFSSELRQIPYHAERIQRELNRAVWNGNIRLAQRADASTHFARVLLWEIGNAGRRTQATFEHSISDLQQTVISSILDDAQLLASLAADILDRNLYERANDCRWWALTSTLMEHLGDGEHDRHTVAAILRHINSLYTVYHGIVLFDAQRRVVAVSNTAHEQYIGQVIQEPWCGAALSLRSSQDFFVSDFAASAFYEDQPTLVYGAAVRTSTGRLAGGIGIVFDSRPQLESILRDALPRAESGEIAEGCISVFVDARMQVIAASSVYTHGQTLPMSADILRTDSREAQIIAVDGMHYAVGIRHTSGYREYSATSMWCVVMIPLGVMAQCVPGTRRVESESALRQGHADSRTGEQFIDLATFHCDGQWLGLLREQVVEGVDGSALRTVPGTPPWHAGLLMYREQPLPVIDLSRFMEASEGGRGRDVVIIRVGEGPMMGLLVDELASIVAVPLNRLRPMAELAQRGGAAIVDRAVRPERADDPMLMILNLEQLLLRANAPLKTRTSSLA